jgi:hypothetical protein
MVNCDVLDSQTSSECPFCKQFQRFLSTMPSTFEFCIPPAMSRVMEAFRWSCDKG